MRLDRPNTADRNNILTNGSPAMSSLKARRRPSSVAASFGQHALRGTAKRAIVGVKGGQGAAVAILKDAA